MNAQAAELARRVETAEAEAGRLHRALGRMTAWPTAEAASNAIWPAGAEAPMRRARRARLTAMRDALVIAREVALDGAETLWTEPSPTPAPAPEWTFCPLSFALGAGCVLAVVGVLVGLAILAAVGVIP